MRAGVTELRNTASEMTYTASGGALNSAQPTRITKHPERCAKATPGERLRNSGRRVITTRVTRRGAEQRAPKARVELRPDSGGRVITAIVCTNGE